MSNQIDPRPLSERMTSRRFLVVVGYVLLVMLAKWNGIELDHAELIATSGAVTGFALKNGLVNPKS